MRRNFFQRAGAALAASFGLLSTKGRLSESKTTEIDLSNYKRPAGQISYLPTQYHGNAKAYGMAVGTGASRKGKSNRLRLTHNAKLKRRAHA